MVVKVYVNFLRWRGRLEVKVEKGIKLNELLKLVSYKIGEGLAEHLTNALDKGIDVLPFIIINGVLVARPYAELGEVEVKDGDDVKIWTPVGGG
jgi:sulfur carrier protein ThiS